MTLLRRAALLILMLSLGACDCTSAASTDGGGGGGVGGSGGGGASGGGTGGSGGGAGGGSGGGSGVATCQSCVMSADCPVGAACVQYAGSNFCGLGCAKNADCASDELCLPGVANDGAHVQVCMPASGTCGAVGCGTCPAGTTCDVIAGSCVATSDGGSGGGAGGGTGGGTGGGDAGVLSGTVGVDGGVVSRLYFAVVGDTRPALIDDTNHYPTAIITQIFQDIAALNPPVQFVVATGDYQFSEPLLGEGPKQLALYAQARQSYSGLLFPAIGNHECKLGLSTGNCAGNLTQQATAFQSTFLTPIGKSGLYYTLGFSDPAGTWSAKLIVTACNFWDSTQKSWLQAQLALPTTYTLLARHQPLGSDGPCNAQMDPMIRDAGYDVLLVGHTHTVALSPTDRQLIEGVGGAPITSTSNYGFATVEQQPGGGWIVRQYDYQSQQVVNQYTLP